MYTGAGEYVVDDSWSKCWFTSESSLISGSHIWEVVCTLITGTGIMADY